MDNIIWKDIIINGIITNYEVNNIGQVRNKINRNILKPSKNDRYKQVILLVNNKRYTKTVHRLVAIAFIPNPENKPQVNHINGIKTDNRVENLEWVTISENEKHAYRTGLKHAKAGLYNNFTIYNEDKIHKICLLLEQKIPLVIISILTGINYQLIVDIKRGNRRKNISKYYNIDKYYKSDSISIKSREIIKIFHSKKLKIKYSKLKKILLELNIFNKIDLYDLLDSKYIIHKKKLLEDLELLGYEIFLYKYEIDKIYGIQNE